MPAGPSSVTLGLVPIRSASLSTRSWTSLRASSSDMPPHPANSAVTMTSARAPTIRDGTVHMAPLSAEPLAVGIVEGCFTGDGDVVMFEGHRDRECAAVLVAIGHQ